MKVIHMREGKKSMQRSVDRSSDGIVAKGAERIHADHLVFQFDATINPGQRKHLIHIKSGKTFDLDAAQVASAALYPEHRLPLPVQRISLVKLRAGVTTSKVGDAQVRSEQVGAVA